ncbi:MAG: B12-binding domain-containing radical SAM protein [Candidatus Scalindua rubra]|uniref:B12-binding domain-containing protein n=1 Tax=Candidatus Scalindua brodae TaxID=237368 RepID=A0A0B0EEC4_9BACT|nr:MAG: hypothetical protein SCABRO_02702 [Candidatus Scalindua brodae]MBZ0108275.1 B12-binding domain-containing radical SAM protein [Candidatus Scalindua rubra]TWU33972.1 B12 binding domain protein [Candidatus Brocadiaceae bacterium S225]
MKILFLLSNFYFVERLGFLYAVSPVKRAGHDVKVLLPQSLTYDHLSDEIRKLDPDIIAYSNTTGEHNYFVKLNKRLKESHNFFSLFGGPHPTFFPDLIHEEGVDGICIGEAEDAMLDLVTKIEKKEDISCVKNFWIKRDGAVHKNPSRELIMDLNKIQFPDRDILYEADNGVRDFHTKCFIASRGCPYKCSYCYNHKLNDIYPEKGTTLRLSSPRNLIDEILDVKSKYPMKFVMFEDDTFILKPGKWLHEFAKLYADEVKLPYFCNVRANLINKETMEILKESGCYSVGMALECGDEKINKNILKKSITNKMFIQAVQLIRKYRIKVRTLNLVALPVKNPLDVDFCTLDTNLKSGTNLAIGSLLYPYPNLEITKYSMDNGYLDSDNSFKNFKTSNNDAAIFNYGDPLVNVKLQRFHKLFSLTVAFPFLRYFTGYLIRLPLSSLYNILNIIWYAYFNYMILVPKKISIKHIPSMTPDFFRYILSLKKY